jgi:glutamate N-acetyltransferase/amino-acid N-acetyltransferase
MNLPKGFLVNALSCGIKKSGKPDLALIYSKVPAKACGVFTANKIKAAPLRVTIEHIKNNIAQAIIVNSGNANCFTGIAGLNDAYISAKLIADKLGIKKNDCLVASTGIIGKRLPVEKIKKALLKLVKGVNRKGIKKVAKSIMTTDTKLKIASKKVQIGNKEIQIIGIAKGAGMIAPQLRQATMLCFIMTDAAITSQALKQALNEAVGSSFNSITIDGCMSTNDMVLVLANGLAKNRLINQGGDLYKFKKALNEISLDIAKQIVKDAEGATKFIEIKVSGAKSDKQAKEGAFAIANSVLFKTAMYGANPNWGRIISALGQAGIDLKEEKIKIKHTSLNKKEIIIYVSLGIGRSTASVFTSDLTPKYVKINAEYS